MTTRRFDFVVGVETDDAPTNTGAFELPKGTTAQRPTPTSGMFRFNTSTNQFEGYNGSAWGAVGGAGGGAFNYVTNPDASGGTSDVTASNCTLAQGTTVGTFSDSYFIISAPSASASVSWATGSAQEKHNGQLMRFSMRIKTTLVGTGTYTIDVYDGSAQVANTNTNLTSGTSIKWDALFVYDTSKTYTVRFRLTAGSANSSDIFYCDDVIISPEDVIIGPSFGPWTTLTPTGTWSTNTTYTGVIRRSGQNMEGRVKVSLSGAPTGNFTVTIPNSLTIDTAALPSGSTFAACGYALGIDSSPSNNYTGLVYVASSTSIRVVTDGSTGNLWTATAPITWASGDYIELYFTVPIAEWSGSSATLANSRIEYASTSGTWDAASTTTAFGASGTAIGGTLTAAREKTITWLTSITPTDSLELQFSQDQIHWMPASTARLNSVPIIPAVNSADSAASGAFLRQGASANQTIVRFEQYAYIANDDSPSTNWPSTNAYWRVVKCSNPLGIGAGLATDTQAGAVDYAKYQEVDISSSGSFSAAQPVIRLDRTSKQVSLSFASLAHSSSATPATASGIIPSGFRPNATITSVYNMDGSRVYSVSVAADGTLSFSYRDWAGSASAATATLAGTVSWTVDG